MFPTFMSASSLQSSLTFTSQSNALNYIMGNLESSLVSGVFPHKCTPDYFSAATYPWWLPSFLWVLPACAGPAWVPPLFPAPGQRTTNSSSYEWQPFTTDLRVVESNYRSENTSTLMSGTHINVLSNLSAIPLHQKFLWLCALVSSSLQLCASYVPSFFFP